MHYYRLNLVSVGLHDSGFIYILMDFMELMVLLIFKYLTYYCGFFKAFLICFLWVHR